MGTLVERITAHLDEAVRERVAAGFERAASRPVTLRANTLAASAGDVAGELDAAGIAHEGVAWYPDAFILRGVRERAVWELDAYRAGRVYLQSLSSMLPPLLLDPGERADILDMCAAPGGKTAQIAALTGNAAHLTACELNAPRAEKLAYNLGKLGAANVNIMRTDARRLDTFFSFDQILLDAPCTGTGTVRAGDERAERRITPQLLAKTTKSQRALLDRGLTILKPGGTLVYSTCSILPEENEQIVRGALARHKDCALAPILFEQPEADERPSHGFKPAPVVLPRALEGTAAIPVLQTDMPQALTVAPGELFEGFFVAVIRRAPR